MARKNFVIHNDPVAIAKIISLYDSEMSIPDVAEKLDFKQSAVRMVLKRAGKLRTRAEAVRLANKQGKIPSRKGVKRGPMDEATRAKLSESHLKLGELNAKGFSKKPSGYIEHTRGPNKSRSVHVTTFECRIGRRILKDEVVHHVDGNRSNNEENNLALMTRAAHSRLHRREEFLSGKRKRANNG